MVEEGPYEILPYAEIDKLKNQIEDLRKKTASSDEILDAINRLVRVMESMLHLFESAAAGMKKGEGLGEKLDKLLDQNETIAESILSLSDIVKELQSKEKEPYTMRERPQPVMPEPAREPMPRIEPGHDFFMPPPDFERLRSTEPSPEFSMPQPSFKRPRHQPTPPRRQMPPGPPPMEGPAPTLPREGPIPMPAGSFKDLNLEKPKKGLFGRFRK